MKSLRWLRGLSIVFQVFGWLLVTDFLVLALPAAYQEIFFQGRLGLFGPNRLGMAVLNFFHLFSSIFFLFLVGSVFQIVIRRGSVAGSRADRFLTLCCFGFVAESVTGFTLQLSSLRNVFTGNWQVIVSQITMLFTQLIPITYAISLFVLYRVFTQLLTFESEVA